MSMTSRERIPSVEYDSDNAEFLRGIEVGYLEALLQINDDRPVEHLVHRFNEEMVRRFAHTYGRLYTTEPVDEAWMVVRFDHPTLPNVNDAIKHLPVVDPRAR